MQITEQVQAEIMEILADDQMKHAEPPSDEEMEKMYYGITQAERIALNKVSALEAERDREEKDAWLASVRAEEFMQRAHEITHRPRYNHEQTPAENRAEQLGDTERSNVESSQARINYHE